MPPESIAASGYSCPACGGHVDEIATACGDCSDDVFGESGTRLVVLLGGETIATGVKFPSGRVAIEDEHGILATLDSVDQLLEAYEACDVVFDV